jgi:hypothetical protein
MTAVLSGTNGLLQSYDYQVPTTGFSYTFAAGTQVLVINPAATLATGTITMPASPSDGMTVTFSSSQQITALSLSGGSASIVGAVTFLPAKTGVSYVYRLANTTWYPTATVPGTGSQLVQGTSVASTSGTSISFTSIPSWVKRITVMFNGMSLSGSANPLIQIGSGSTDITGYVSTSAAVIDASSSAASSSTAGFIMRSATASNTNSGHMVLTNISGNIWISSHYIKTATTTTSIGGGDKTLSGVLDRVVITTTNGTDTFDAGSINILYE